MIIDPPITRATVDHDVRAKRPHDPAWHDDGPGFGLNTRCQFQNGDATPASPHNNNLRSSDATVVLPEHHGVLCRWTAGRTVVRGAGTRVADGNRTR